MNAPDPDSFALIQTKLQRPRLRGGLISRPPLLERLSHNLVAENGTGARQLFNHKLTLISAPAGFGKTTLIVQWLDDLQWEGGRDRSKTQERKSAIISAWLSLDEADNDPARFWTYFIAALQAPLPTPFPNTDKRLGQAALGALGSPQPANMRAALTNLINELGLLPRPVVIILDDYHVVANSEIHEGLAFLLTHQPPQLHLVILTRADPPLPVARLRAHRQLVELREADLRFTPAEAATFLNEVMGLALTGQQVQALEGRTEGWIVGLQLAALAIQSSRPSPSAADQLDMRDATGSFIEAFTGSHHYILEYLTEEVLARQSEAARQFLLQTSILDRLCAPLCDAVACIDDSAALLAYLYHNNLFIIALDESHTWFRYHHLLAELLHNLLQQARPEEDIRALHGRASAWYEQNGAIENAIQHAIQAQHYERVADLVEKAAKNTLYSGRLATLLGWLEAIPPELLASRPRLRIYQGWALFLGGQSDRAERILSNAKKTLLARPPAAGNQALRGEVAALLATIYSMYEDTSRTITEAQEALAHLPEDELVWRARAMRALAVGQGLQGKTEQLIQTFNEASKLALASGNPFLAADSLANIGSFEIQRGRLRQAEAIFKQAIDLAVSDSALTSPVAGLGYKGLAEVYLEWNQLDAAEEYLDKGIRLCRQGGIGYNLATAYCIKSRLSLALGDDQGALAALRQAEEALQPSASLPLATLLAVYRVNYHLRLGEVQMAVRWAEGLSAGETEPVSPDRLPIVVREVQQVSLARVRLAQGQLEQVLAIVDQVQASAGPAGRQARVIESSLYRALALHALGQTNGALASLQHCLALAGPEGYARIFADEGQPMAALLRQAKARDLALAFVDGLLSLLVPAHPKAQVPGSAAAIEPVSIESLTRRELEVLGQICQGYSNQEIANRLVISLHTVKKHNSNIYAKLGVSSRSQAIAVAHDLGLS